MPNNITIYFFVKIQPSLWSSTQPGLPVVILLTFLQHLVKAVWVCLVCYTLKKPIQSRGIQACVARWIHFLSLLESYNTLHCKLKILTLTTILLFPNKVHIMLSLNARTSPMCNTSEPTCACVSRKSLKHIIRWSRIPGATFMPTWT